MFRTNRILCLLVALLWVPLTQHCDLEAIGALADQCAEGAGNLQDHCRNDVCSIVESASYRGEGDELTVSQPALTASVCNAWVNIARIIAPKFEAAPVNAVERPRDWVPGWSFERRAAAPAHAPDWVNV